MNYKTFDDWFQENIGGVLRSERFYDEFYKSDVKRLTQWLQEAWNAARLDTIRARYEDECG